MLGVRSAGYKVERGWLRAFGIVGEGGRAQGRAEFEEYRGREEERVWRRLLYLHS